MAGKHHLNVLNFGLAFGLGFGIYVLFIGTAAWLFGWGMALVELVSSWYIGFAPTFSGSIIGAVWGFIDGFIGGVVIAWLYNKFSKSKKFVSEKEKISTN